LEENGGRTAAAKGEAASVAHDREERKRREREEEEATRRFKLRPVDPTGLARLSHTAYSGVTCGHTTQGGWAASHAKADDATHSCQTTRHDWRLRGTTSPVEHAPVHMMCLFHKSRQPDWRDSNGPDLKFCLPRFISQILIKKGLNRKKLFGCLG
jgi:hypothetical protein